MPKQDRQSIYEAVTQQIVAQIEAGPEAWKASWSHTASTWAPANAQTARHYQGINTLILALRCAERGFTINRWVTFRQAKLLGGQVRKGEKGTRVIFFKPYDDPRSAGRDEDSDSPSRRACLRNFYVFNVAQCDGLPSAEHTPPPPAGLASEIVQASGATIVDGAPCHVPTTDAVHLPPHTRFTSLADYHATAFHELVHWTHKRVGREVGGARCGSDAYAREELVAELGAAMLCGACGIQPTQSSEHAAYLSHWLRILKSDSKAIFTVAADAQRAASYLLNRVEADAAEAAE